MEVFVGNLRALQFGPQYTKILIWISLVRHSRIVIKLSYCSFVNACCVVVAAHVCSLTQFL